MSRCTRCDKEITSGYMLCSRCYERINVLERGRRDAGRVPAIDS